ncbi:long-chain-fatty-acid--CoA ligase [Haliea sp.]|jgi:acyl-CoA synthetase (AMP-forming)/AMP-acid ligase II|uniref:long-chain-fatty-acid--CoA ligase n=1 Tax=Haliea sp. TaxID=1932666 RepID=UPI00257DD416|nr:long-chain-fatty-acid--CoA ligase [Haliea sp.]
MNVNLADMLRDHALQRPHAPCLSFVDETLSYEQLHQRSSQLANALLQRGLVVGDRVAIVARNAPVFYELAFACAKAGLIMVPINWRLSARELDDILVDATPGAVFADAEFADKLPGTVSTMMLDESYAAWRNAASDSDPHTPTTSDDTVLLLYTSGTTGRAKGAMISHRNMTFTSRMAHEVWGFGSDSVNLVAGPLFHIGGIGYGMMALTQGGHTVLLQQPSPRPALDAIVRHRITHAFLVPAVIQSLVEADGVDDMDLTSLQLIAYGASPISGTLLLRAMKVFGCGFSHAYGLTETSGTVITLPPEAHDPYGDGAARLRSCGRPVPWVEIDLFDPQTDLPVNEGDVGEIRVRSGMTMTGYWNNPEETRATFAAGGWLRTGDAAWRDAAGYYYIHDRFKDMIVSGGENIYPTEVENVLYEHPDVAATAVIGVPHERWGETPKAVVVRRSGSAVSEQELIEFLRQRLAHYKCPTSVEFVEDMPRSASGKILKRELRLMEWPARKEAH